MKIRVATTENEARFHHYAAVMKFDEFEWLGAIEPPFTDDKFSGVDAFICSCEHHWPTRLAIAACKRLNIPTFHVLDGIAEWRNLFENPRSSDPANGAPLFQPLLSDLTFAMGEVQKRTLEWLGNESKKIVATGLPRLDQIAPEPCRIGALSKRPKLLIATANTPWFTEEQKEIFLQEFEGLTEGLRALSNSSEAPDHEVTWRLAQPVADALGLHNDLDGTATAVLSSCDALITTPSSLAVEAMLLGVPTLVFDPYACPVLTPSAWSANASLTVLRLLPSLLIPSSERAGLQDAIRQSIVQVGQGSGDRVCGIIRSVVNDAPLPVEPVSGMDLVSNLAPGSDGMSGRSMGELQGLAATIPALERIIAEKQQAINDLLYEREKPTLRHALGSLYRSIARVWR